MYCENCGKEIGTKNECNYCGYDPMKDDPVRAASAPVEPLFVTPPPVKIALKKMKNGCATAGLVFGIFNVIPLFWIISWPLSFIFSLIGFARSKARRSGRVRSIFGLISCILVVAIIASIIAIVCVMWANGTVDSILDGVLRLLDIAGYYVKEAFNFIMGV